MGDTSSKTGRGITENSGDKDFETATGSPRPLWEMQPTDADTYFGKGVARRAAIDPHGPGGGAGGVL